MDSGHEMLRSLHHEHLLSPQKFYDCIESCFECASASWICADACLNEEDAMFLQDCIRNCLTCAEICAATAKGIIAQPDDSDFIMTQLKACMEICQMTEHECLKYREKHEHCSICAKCCGACVKTCRNYIEELAA